MSERTDGAAMAAGMLSGPICQGAGLFISERDCTGQWINDTFYMTHPDGRHGSVPMRSLESWCLPSNEPRLPIPEPGRAIPISDPAPIIPMADPSSRRKPEIEAIMLFMDNQNLKVSEIAIMLGCNKSTVYRWKRLKQMIHIYRNSVKQRGKRRDVEFDDCD